MVIDRLNETLDQKLKRWHVPSLKDGQMSSFRRSVSAMTLKASFRRRSSQLDEMEDDTNKDDQVKKMDERYNIGEQGGIYPVT